MLTKFVLKSAKDRFPSINVSELNKSVLGRTKLKSGDTVEVTLATTGGPNGSVHIRYPANVSRDGKTLYFRGWNEALFDLPSIPSKTGFVQHNVVSVDTLSAVEKKALPKAKIATAPRTTTVRVTSNKSSTNTKSSNNGCYPSKTQLQRLLKETNGVKVWAAEIIGVSPRTFGRMLKAVGLA